MEGVGFVSAGELQADDIIRTSDGRNFPIKKIEIEELAGTVTVYNFEVEDFHTYYVSQLGVLVHNMCMMSKDGHIQYGELDSLGRTTEMKAIITQQMLGTGTGPNASIIQLALLVVDQAVRVMQEVTCWQNN